MSLRGISDRIFPPDPQLHTDRPPPTPLHTGFTAGLSWWTGPDLSEIWELKIYFFSLFGYFGGIFVPLLLLSPTRPPTRSLVSLQIGWGGGRFSRFSCEIYKNKQKTKNRPCKSFGPCWPAGMHHIRNRVFRSVCVQDNPLCLGGKLN